MIVKMAAEKKFESKIKSELRRRNACSAPPHGGTWFVKFFANAFTPAGIPDILACYRGRFLGIEVKGGSSYGLTDLQKYNLKKIREAGGIGICVYPSGWGQFLEMLDRLDSGEQVIVTDEDYILK